MAGTFSGHVIQQFEAQANMTNPNQHSNLTTAGQVASSPTMHGTSNPMPSTSSHPPYSPHELQKVLEKKLGPEYISTRSGGGGGGKLTYVEGWKMINLANEVFGYDGWNSSIVSLTTDFMDIDQQGRVAMHVTAVVRVTLVRTGVFHEDVGNGTAENSKGKSATLDKVRFFSFYLTPTEIKTSAKKRR